MIARWSRRPNQVLTCARSKPHRYRSWLEPGALSKLSTLSTLFTAEKPIGATQVTIPVRLSQAQHRRLKQWSTEHNFPMAVVIRGLIERFLDGWEERAA